jgi:hypothetical protein
MNTLATCNSRRGNPSLYGELAPCWAWASRSGHRQISTTAMQRHEVPCSGRRRFSDIGAIARSRGGTSDHLLQLMVG